MLSEKASGLDAMLYNRNNCQIDLGIPFHIDKETLLISSMLGQKPVKFVAFNEIRTPEKKYAISSPWFNDYDLIKLNTPGDAESFDSEFINNLALRLLFDGSRMIADETYSLDVVVINKNDQKLFSGDSETYRLRLCYHWFQGRETVVWDGELTPLETDVISKLTQPVKVIAPGEPGEYRLVVDLVLVGKTWARLDAEVMVVVD